MVSLSAQNLLIALIIIVPGFITTHIALSFGVIRTEISKWRLLIVSLATSLIVVTLYLSILQANGTKIQGLSEVEGIFFTPTFNPIHVFGLLVLSAFVGVIGAILLASDIHHKFRDVIWTYALTDRRRAFHEPWEGTLDDAARVQILTSDGALVVGGLRQYSDDEKEKQISLTGAEWKSPNSEEWKDPDTDIELLFGKDIQQVTVIDKQGNAEDRDPEQ